MLVLSSFEKNFNPRSSYEERPFDNTPKNITLKFQSTLLIRGATITPDNAVDELSISIHAPHTRSDPNVAAANVVFWVFQSTLLIRGATFSG